jgi:hypothetical protein
MKEQIVRNPLTLMKLYIRGQNNRINLFCIRNCHRECQNIHDFVFQNIIELFMKVYSLIEIPHGIYFLKLCIEYGPQLAKF